MKKPIITIILILAFLQVFLYCESGNIINYFQSQNAIGQVAEQASQPVSPLVTNTPPVVSPPVILFNPPIAAVAKPAKPVKVEHRKHKIKTSLGPPFHWGKTPVSDCAR